MSSRNATTAVAALCAVLAGAACIPEAKRPELQEAAAQREKEREREVALLLTPSDALAVPEDAVVRVVGPQMTCSGTLIRDDLVLTAHHCVVERGPHGEFLSLLVPHEKLTIDFGGDDLAWGEAGVRAVVAPPCGEAGGRGDVAVLVLERKKLAMWTYNPRLEAPPQRGELLVPMGFGRCARSPEGIRRHQREGGPVFGVQSGTFEIEAAICPGDSGGPVLAAGTHEIVGVVSLSAMTHDERTRNLSVMARIDAFRSTFTYARAIADGTAAQDLPPLSCD